MVHCGHVLMKEVEFEFKKHANWFRVRTSVHRTGRSDGLVVEPMSPNLVGWGSIPRLGSRGSSFISIEHAELLRSTPSPSLVLCWDVPG